MCIEDYHDYEYNINVFRHPKDGYAYVYSIREEDLSTANFFPPLKIYECDGKVVKEISTFECSLELKIKNGGCIIEEIPTVSMKSTLGYSVCIAQFERLLRIHCDKDVEQLKACIDSTTDEIIMNFNDEQVKNFNYISMTTNIDLYLDKHAVSLYTGKKGHNPGKRYKSYHPFIKELQECIEPQLNLVYVVEGKCKYPVKGNFISEVKSFNKLRVLSDVNVSDNGVTSAQLSYFRSYVINKLSYYGYRYVSISHELEEMAKQKAGDLEGEERDEFIAQYSHNVLSEYVSSGETYDCKYGVERMNAMLDAFYCSRDLSYQDSEELLYLMCKYGLTLFGTSVGKYFCMDIPFVSQTLLWYIGNILRRYLKSGNVILSDQNQEYNSSDFIKRLSEFLSIVCTYDQFTEELYERYSDAIDYLLFNFTESDFYKDELKYNRHGLSFLDEMKFGLMYDGRYYRLVHFDLRLNGFYGSGRYYSKLYGDVYKNNYMNVWGLNNKYTRVYH